MVRSSDVDPDPDPDSFGSGIQRYKMKGKESSTNKVILQTFFFLTVCLSASILVCPIVDSLSRPPFVNYFAPMASFSLLQ